MALTLTNGTLTTTFDSTESDTNFANVVSKFNANIVNADINASAAIAVSKLASSKEHLVLHAQWNGADEPFLTQGDWPATTVLGYIVLPAYDDATDWTVTDAEWVCTDIGGSAGTFKVEFGDFSTGSFVANTTVVTADTIDAKSGQCAIASGTIAFNSTNTKMFAITTIATDATAMTDATDIFAISILMKRDISNS